MIHTRMITEGYAMAHGQGLASRTPLLGKWLTHSDSPSLTRSRWYPHRAKPGIDWVDFDGDPDAGLIPRSYRMAGIVAVDAEMLDDAQTTLRDNGRMTIHAAAYALGDPNGSGYEWLMVGAMQGNRTHFGKTNDMPDMYQVAERIGRPDAHFTGGLRDIQNGDFYHIPGSVSRVARVPIPEIPLSVPMQ